MPKNLNLKIRLYLSFACMWSIMMFFAVFRSQQLHAVMERYNEAMNSITARQQCIGNIITYFNRLRFDNVISGALYDYPDFYYDVHFIMLNQDRDSYIEILRGYLVSYRYLILTDVLLNEEQMQAQIAILDYIEYTLNQHYIPSMRDFLEAIESDNSEGAAASFFMNFPIGDYISDLVWELRDKNFTFSEYITETMVNYNIIDERIFNVATIMGISLAIILAILLANNIQNQQKNYNAQLQEALRDAEVAYIAKTHFIANTSHEIRTPMNSIIGYSELAMDDIITPATKRYLEKITINAKWLLNIINDIMDFSKIESSNLELDIAPLDVNEVLENARVLVENNATEKGIRLYTFTDIPAGKSLSGDFVKLSQVCINLLSNAVKFTELGHVTCNVTMVEKDSRNCTLKFEITDTGIGINPEQLSTIFEPFMQANTNISREYGGTGLGLAITKRLIEAMGGEVQVESTLGMGSKFFFQLTFGVVKPFEDTPEPASIINEANNPDFRPYFDKGEVLVADDNEMNQGVICEHLNRVGLTTAIARNGREAVDMVNHRLSEGKKLFDLIFMDIHMPVMDGVEATAIISDLNTGIPIIAMTASLETIKDRFSNAPIFDGYVGKPFTAKELHLELIKHLRPIEKHSVSGNALTMESDLHKKILVQFAKSNQNIHEEITSAINTGDITLAHRLAHSLKSNAGMIKETTLQTLAAKIERELEHGAKSPSSELMQLLKKELYIVFQSLTPLLEEEELKPSNKVPVDEVSNEELQKIICELEPLLNARNVEALNYINRLNEIPGAETLVEQIENFDMKEAASTLAELKKNLFA